MEGKNVSEILMEEQIKILIELQGLDREIFRLEKELAAKPGEIKTLEDIYKNKEEEAKNIDAELKKVQLEHKNKEMELKTKEESIKKLQSQLYQVKTNKEYTAMDTEIKSARADCSLLEDGIINLLDKIEEIEKIKEQGKEQLKVEQKKLEGEKKVISEGAKKIEEELSMLKAKRKEVSEKVDKTILAKYERILYNKDGLALVPVRGNACQGCFLNLPPQVINEIKMKKDFVFCESCARLLYLEE
ncbi:MAG: hypothetical protein COS99_04705 [Candidatus Omnitrophica bacterium CG07_land_8_20_14_0_80_42_15]|uniref:Uncharacterized protein n=1 Tax=Candidatus Aquitaenariimonas noxiae TaxID=1974741 RepID=A0A2J0KT87_9BACT|nr:MAG: hypothetical protein COS99_04705 [Candidatus Omnitrophica bacterium CG07_land_8_20_14_0_80_42_15]